MLTKCLLNERRGIVSAVVLCATVGVAFPVPSVSQDLSISFSEQQGSEIPFSGEEYWTQDRMDLAEPMPLPDSSDFATELGEAVELDLDTPTTFRRASSPLTHPVSTFQEPFEPDISSSAFNLDAEQDDADDAPFMWASKGYPFTSRRASPNSLVKTWPFRTTGKLFFTAHPDAGGGNFVCSASTINRRVVLTAGHCLYDREVNRFHRNFYYVPAYNGTLNPTAPYCGWSYTWVIVPNQWANSSGFPTSDDFGILEARDRDCLGATRRVGAFLGWLGWATKRLIGNNITQLGYPGNLDSGRRMQVSQSNVFERTSSAGEIGSAQGGGTSGGPWIQNFGISPAGQVAIGPAGYTGRNQVVGVSSYGNVDHNPHQYGGASVLNDNFVRIFDKVCAHRTGNCN